MPRKGRLGPVVKHRERPKPKPRSSIPKPGKTSPEPLKTAHPSPRKQRRTRSSHRPIPIALPKRGHSRTFAGLSGQIRARHAGADWPVGLSPSHPNGEPQPAKNRPKGNPAISGHIRSKAARSGHARRPGEGGPCLAHRATRMPPLARLTTYRIGYWKAPKPVGPLSKRRSAGGSAIPTRSTAFLAFRFLLLPQRRHRIESHCAQRRSKGSNQHDEHEKDGCQQERQWVEFAYAVQHRPDVPRERPPAC